MEKFCPACSRVYNDDAAVCEVDGERLVLLNDEPSLVGHVLDGKYTLLSKLGEGGMGSVYLAEQATMGREVAIKVLRREFSQNRTAIKRFLREARAASKLNHSNTITVYDFGQSNEGLLYLVMERLTGSPLADILDQEGALPPARAAHILGQICDSLAEAHRQGIFHRDLKPENIFIEQQVGNDDFVKVLDFGIAKMQGDDATGQATATGMICGTPSYMSPEQAMGKEIDGRSDIYALGVLLYEMLSNEKPFEGDTPMEVMLKHINEPSPDIYERTGIQVPHGVQATVDRLLAKRVADRPADCQEAKRMLLAGLETPLIGPPRGDTDAAGASLPPAAEFPAGQNRLEKTGLSQVAPGREFTPPPPKRSRAWLWWVAAGVIAVVVMALGDKAERSKALSVASQSEATRVDEVPQAAKRVTAEAGAPVDDVAAADSEGTEEVAPAVVEDTAEAALEDVAVLEEVEVQALPVEGEQGEVLKVESDASSDTQDTKVRIALNSEPSGAQVFEGEALLGTTPITFERARHSGTVKLNLRQRGFKTQFIELGTVGDVAHTVELTRLPRGGTREPAKDAPPHFGTF